MEYELAKKAFWAGLPEAVSRKKTGAWLAPDDFVGIVYADTHGQAKGIFARDNYMNFVEVAAIRAKEHDLYHFEEGELSIFEIENKLKLREWRRLNSEAATTSPEMQVVIYSSQWGAFWRENANGYTQSKDDAGVYTMKRAWELTAHCGLEKGIEIRPLHQN